MTTRTYTSLPELIAAHQGSVESALDALWMQYSSLAEQDDASQRAQQENTKLWGLLSNFKREKDAASKECERLAKERHRLDRRIAELELACRTYGVSVTPSLDLSPEEARRQPNARQYSSDGRPSNHRARNKDRQSSTSSTSQIRVLKNDRPPSPPASASATQTSFKEETPHRTLNRKASSVDLGKPSASVSSASAAVPVPMVRSPALSVHDVMEVSTPPPDKGRHDLTPKQHPSPYFSLSSVPIHSSPFDPLFPSGGSSSNVSPVSPTPALEQAATKLAGLTIDTTQHQNSAENSPVNSFSPVIPREGSQMTPSTPTRDASSFLPDFPTPSKRAPTPDQRAAAFEDPDSPVAERYLPKPLQRQIEEAREPRPRASSAPLQPITPSPSIQSLSASAPQQQSPTRVQLIKLTPANLQLAQVKVPTSMIKTNDRFREVVTFAIQVSLVSPEQQVLSQWSIEKKWSDVLELDAHIKNKHSKQQHRKLASLPEKSLFKDHAPSKVDLRKNVLEKYLQSLVDVPLDDKTAICTFLQTDIHQDRTAPVANPSQKAGYLTKKGRWVGNWQTRYYVLKGPLLQYWDAPNGSKLGEIDVTGSSIGRQHNQKESQQSGDSYRHAFLIREVRKASGARGSEREEVDHILCADDDADRDAWVKVLAAWHTGEYVQPQEPRPGQADERTGSAQSMSGASRAARKVSKDDIARGSAQPLSKLQQDPSNAKLFGGPVYQEPHAPPQVAKHRRDESAGLASLNSSANGTDLEELTSTGKTPTLYMAAKRRNDLSDIQSSTSLPSNLDAMATLNQPVAQPFPRPSSELGHHSGDSVSDGPSNPRPPSPDKRAKISGPMNPAPITGGFKQSNRSEERRVRTKSSFWNFAARNGSERHPAAAAQPRPVFGVPLQEAVNVARVKEGFDLPAVVYRCVEYLEAKGAVDEEGLYRLSGSAAVIKGLKDRFNNEGDVNLVASSSSEYFDPHAVAGLLKLFLRELPVHVLTRELQSSFFQVIDLARRSERVNELGALIAQLPIANYSLLRFLSAHLMNVVQNEKVNKMTLRNIGIVFSPTLNIPAPLFSLMLTEFEHVFNVLDDQPAPLRMDDDQEQSTSRTVSIPNLQIEGAAEAHRQSRNSLYYSKTGADALMEMRGTNLVSQEEEDSSTTDAEDSPPDSDTDVQAGFRHSPLGSSPSPMDSQSGESYFDAPSHPSQQNRAAQQAGDKGLKIVVPRDAAGRASSPISSPLGLPRSPRPR